MPCEILFFKKWIQHKREKNKTIAAELEVVREVQRETVYAVNELLGRPFKREELMGCNGWGSISKW